MEIRRNQETNNEVNDLIDEMDDDDDISAYPTEWEEVKKEMNLIYFDEEEEGEI